MVGAGGRRGDRVERATPAPGRALWCPSTVSPAPRSQRLARRAGGRRRGASRRAVKPGSADGWRSGAGPPRGNIMIVMFSEGQARGLRSSASPSAPFLRSGKPRAPEGEAHNLSSPVSLGASSIGITGHQVASPWHGDGRVPASETPRRGQCRRRALRKPSCRPLSVGVGRKSQRFVRYPLSLKTKCSARSVRRSATT